MTLTISGALLAAGTARAQLAFSEDFDTDHTANWTVNSAHQTPGTNSAEFFFDYSSVGIPSAPHSTGGTTRGLRLEANKAGANFSGISVSPTGQSFIGDYEIRFDMWINYHGPLNGGSPGSTQITGVGVGTAGTTPQWAGGVHDCVHFGVTGDGGSSQDYRAYPKAALANTNSGVYAAGTTFSPDSRNSTHPYYAGFGGEAAPAAQVALYSGQTGVSDVGSQGFRWRYVIVKKAGNSITYTIDTTNIATVDISAITLGGNNILFNYYDINSGSSANVNATNLLFGLIDNVVVSNLSQTVSVTAPTPDASETGPVNGVFTFTRSGDTTGSLTVNYSLGGNAVNGTDYTTLATSVTFAPGETSTNVTVAPIDDGISELTEKVVLSITPNASYALGIPTSATVAIADNDAQVLQISAVTPSMYEHSPYDYATLLITRLGDLSFPSSLIIDSSNIVVAGLGGTAVSNLDFIVTNLPVQIDSFSTGIVVNLLMPLDDSLLEGPETVVVGMAAGTGYTVSPSTATINLIDDEYIAPERILFSDTLNDDSGANWKTAFAANNGIDDKSVLWASSLSPDNVPNAPNGSPTALKLTVNKDEPTANGAAGVNVYPLNKSFSNNFALRFNAYWRFSSAATTEFATFGINHSGNKTNWFIQTGTGPVLPTDADGYFFGICGDGSGSAPADYALFRGAGAAAQPLQLQSASSASFLNIFKSPPFQFGGALDNAQSPVTGTWADVEVRKVNNTISLRINNTPILTQTNATNYASGDIMLGYCDPYSSIGAGGAIYYSNLRVVDLTPSISAVAKVGANILIDFSTGDLNDTTASFKLQSASSVAGPYADDGTASISAPSLGKFRATIPPSGAAQFYRVRHL